jgi:hypothetical protein
MRRIAIATAAAATLLLIGCQKAEDQAPAASAEQAAPVERVSAPTGNDPEGWKAYMRQELQPHMDQRRFRRPFSYFIPMVDSAAADATEQQRQFDAQAEAVQNAVGRGIQAGTMLSFAGPDSAAIASVIDNAFKLAAPQSLKGVRIVVIAKPEVRAQIEAAIVPSGAEFIFVDMQ